MDLKSFFTNLMLADQKRPSLNPAVGLPVLNPRRKFQADMSREKTGHPTKEGQLILKCPFGVFKSTKKSINFRKDFCPSLSN